MTPSAHDQAPTAAIADELRTTVARLVRRMRDEYTIPSHQLSALSLLDRHGPCGTSQLAALLHVRPQSMAHTVQQLQKAGFVSRHQDPHDGRQQLIRLTPTGQAALDDLRRDSSSWLTQAMDASLTSDELATVREAIALLDRVIGS